MTLSDELAWRGFINQATFKDLTVLDAKPISFYWGVDPSADSMTIGNLAAAMMVKCFIKHGHKAYLLIGGATGMIGDPDGKSSERQLLSLEMLNANKRAIAGQYETIFGRGHFKLVDNNDWFKEMRYLDFLRDVGKHVPMRQMLTRDFVQTRLGQQGNGISYAEFSYVLIQAYDFLRLYEDEEVSLQVCGSDQWGNSVAGVDLIRRKTGGQAHVLSTPLIVDKTSGQKFGKSEAGAIWLDSRKTSVYQFYQFWLNADDDNAEEYLKIFTSLGKDQIDDITHKFNQNRSARLAQKTLAHEVTKLMHGQTAADSQQRISAVLFGSEDALELSQADYLSLEKELPVVDIPRRMTLEDLVKSIVTTGLASSNTEARRLVESGAIYINNVRMPEGFKLDAHASRAMMRRGRNNSAVLRIIG